MAASYVGLAFHQPDKMPKDPGTRKPVNSEPTKADAAYVKAWFQAQAKRG